MIFSGESICKELVERDRKLAEQMLLERYKLLLTTHGVLKPEPTYLHYPNTIPIDQSSNHYAAGHNGDNNLIKRTTYSTQCQQNRQRIHKRPQSRLTTAST